MTPTDPVAILSFLSSRNASIQIFRMAEPYILPSQCWSVRFEVEHQGALLSVKSVAASMDDAINEAWAKLERFLR